MQVPRVWNPTRQHPRPGVGWLWGQSSLSPELDSTQNVGMVVEEEGVAEEFRNWDAWGLRIWGTGGAWGSQRSSLCHRLLAQAVDSYEFTFSSCTLSRRSADKANLHLLFFGSVFRWEFMPLSSLCEGPRRDLEIIYGVMRRLPGHGNPRQWGLCSLSLPYVEPSPGSSHSQNKDPERGLCYRSPQDKAFTPNSFLRAPFMSLFLRQ